MEPRGRERHRRAAHLGEKAGANESNALQFLSVYKMQERFMNASAVVFLRDVTARVAHGILHFLNCVGWTGRHGGNFSIQH